MYIRAFLPVFLAVVALLGVTTSNTSAATLWTTSTHVARVTPGGSVTLTGTSWTSTSGGATTNICADVRLTGAVIQNTDPGIVLGLTNGAFNGCTPFLYTPTFSPSWTLTISGTSYFSGTSTCWNSRIDSVHYDLAGLGAYTGNLTSGVTTCQPTAAGAPLRIQLESSGTLSGPTADTIDSTFDLVGTSAAWSLTN